MSPINSKVTLKVGLFLLFILASCATKKSLFYCTTADTNLKGKIKSIDEKSFKAVYTNSGIITGDRKRQFNFEDDTQKLYDTSGRLSYEIYTKLNDSIHFEMSYKYSGSDTIFKYRKYVQDDTFSLYSKQYFRDKYLITEFAELFGYKTYFWKDKYNRKGKVKVSYVYENNSQTKEINLDSKRIAKYRQGTFSATTYNPDKSIWSILKRSFNQNNDDSTMFISFPKHNDTKNYRYIYEYDENKNWTKQVQYINDTARFVVIREIKYY